MLSRPSAIDRGHAVVVDVTASIGARVGLRRPSAGGTDEMIGRPTDAGLRG